MEVFLWFLLFTATTAAALPSVLTNHLLLRRQAPCDYQQALTCLTSMPNLEKSASLFSNVYTPSDLERQCGLLTEKLNCVVNMTRDCPELQQLSTALKRTFEGLLDYICSETGREIVLAESDCWENEELQTESIQCAERTDKDQFQTCQIMAMVQNCTTSAATNLCNPRAATLVNNVLYYAMQPVMDTLLGCEVTLTLDHRLNTYIPTCEQDHVATLAQTHP